MNARCTHVRARHIARTSTTTCVQLAPATTIADNTTSAEAIEITREAGRPLAGDESEPDTTAHPRGDTPP